MGFGDTFSFVQYTGDSGTAYAVKLSAAVAAQGGFSTALSPIGNPVWPWKAHMMRHVNGKSASGKYARIPLATNSNSDYVSGGTFSLHGIEYTILGAEGERRPANAIK